MGKKRGLTRDGARIFRSDRLACHNDDHLNCSVDSDRGSVASAPGDIKSNRSPRVIKAAVSRKRSSHGRRRLGQGDDDNGGARGVNKSTTSSVAKGRLQREWSSSLQDMWEHFRSQLLVNDDSPDPSPTKDPRLKSPHRLSASPSPSMKPVSPATLKSKLIKSKAIRRSSFSAAALDLLEKGGEAALEQMSPSRIVFGIALVAVSFLLMLIFVNLMQSPVGQARMSTVSRMS
eukprot:GFYU01002271.1.p1 GENE.GFYU01002271.1~~GFYU01002271.1.p1  ORF type:complete len:232 (-),score=40.12 GFYU01002271.1:175-870(-)